MCRSIYRCTHFCAFIYSFHVLTLSFLMTVRLHEKSKRCCELLTSSKAGYTLIAKYAKNESEIMQETKSV